MIRRLRVSGELWVDMLKHETPVTIRVSRDALPADARYKGVTYNEEARCFELLIESAAFRDDDPLVLAAPAITLVEP